MLWTQIINRYLKCKEHKSLLLKILGTQIINTKILGTKIIDTKNIVIIRKRSKINGWLRMSDAVMDYNGTIILNNWGPFGVKYIQQHLFYWLFSNPIQKIINL